MTAEPVGLAGSDAFFEYVADLRETASFDLTEFRRTEAGNSIHTLLSKPPSTSCIARKRSVRTLFQ